MKSVRIVTTIFIIALFLSSCGLNMTTTTFSVTIIGDDDILLEEADVSITHNKNTLVTYKDCILYVMENNNIEYELDDKGYRIKSMFGFPEYIKDEIYADSGAYWYMKLNQNQITNMDEEKIDNGDNLEISYIVYDRHEFCGQ